ncbi:hypothetical protein CPB83DRAFT_850350 [Crepidotus variabilis]|uniref:Uncharacterized protein n=1 Tax=Crepidotus variabilis TaxID=179855 RepID=A0A9P6EKK7_9AGAR|nr:hypothetical protein CPB83DRAFT_850350 [Crepidotus variabilis]
MTVCFPTTRLWSPTTLLFPATLCSPTMLLFPATTEMLLFCSCASLDSLSIDTEVWFGL